MPENNLSSWQPVLQAPVAHRVEPRLDPGAWRPSLSQPTRCCCAPAKRIDHPFADSCWPGTPELAQLAPTEPHPSPDEPGHLEALELWVCPWRLRVESKYFRENSLISVHRGETSCEATNADVFDSMKTYA